MKAIGLILYFACLTGCGNANKKIDNRWAESMKAADTTLHSLPAIGNCYAYKLNKDTTIGLLLAAISYQEDTTFYSFILSGKLFNHIPTKEQFEAAGLSGLSVPGPRAGDFQKTFCKYSTSKQHLESLMDKMILVNTISNLSNKNIFGSSGSIQNPEDLKLEYSLFEIRNKQAKEDMKQQGFPTSTYQVFDWNSLLIASNPGEVAKPETIWVLSAKTAHPLAAKLMKGEWFWNPADDLSPFGNDSGSDAFYIFRDWRKDNLETEPAQFLGVLEQRWGLSFNYKEIVSENELEKVEKLNPYYRQTDEAIIGVSFGQLALEGTVSKELKNLGVKAIERTMLPIAMVGMSDGNKTEYTRRLKIMLSILNQF
jgi:uncharacterized protein YfeS